MIKPEYGDVICVNHGIYNHFGIFVDKNHVIHYSGKEKDMFFREMVIDETDMENFLGGSDKYYVYRFSQDKPSNVNRIRAEGLGRDLIDDVQALYLIYQIKNKIKFKVYTPEETVKRARSRIGERKFLLHANNCEHFAIWCKTGVRQSYQVNAVIKAVFVKYLTYEGY
ncbi:hypothetical protein TPELB_28370 [Terrisporobacter petrolearius]|uniref:LRAT domain-containing protein n=1 Tax=Terrisporobacter petrolearius TaxID=1460447 RepID=A0ABZ3FIJ0_9FIRM